MVSDPVSGRKHFPCHWEPMPDVELVRRIVLEHTSDEYLRVARYLPPKFTLHHIERIQNPYLWEMYQNRRDLLLRLHNQDPERLNERYLWHGTKHANIQDICSNNLDWRRHGRNAGQVYGQGTYFSSDASMSANYALSSQKHERCMLLMRVLVGKCAVGSSRMTMPPMGCEATVDNVRSPLIFVKYHDQDFYPEYVISFSGGC